MVDFLSCLFSKISNTKIQKMLTLPTLCITGKLGGLGVGVFWVRSDLDSGKKIRVFYWGGGMFWVRSVLESGKKISFFNFQGRDRGCSGYGQIWTLERKL